MDASKDQTAPSTYASIYPSLEVKTTSNNECIPSAARSVQHSMELIKIYNKISPKIAQELLQMLENMDRQYNRLLELKTKAEKTTVPTKISRAIMDQCQKCDEFMKDLNQKLQEVLPLVNNQDMDAMMALGKMTTQFENCALSETQVNAFMDENNGSLVRAINLYKDLSEKKIFIGDEGSLTEIKRQTKEKDQKAVVFFFSTNTSDTDYYQKTVDLFFQMTKDDTKRTIAINVNDNLNILAVEKIDGPNKIAIIKAGIYDCYDFLAERTKVATLNFANPGGQFGNKAKDFADTVYAVFPCPGAECSTANLKWACAICCYRLEYDLEGNFYCNCGCQPIEKYTFRCCHAEHGSKDAMFGDVVRLNLKKLKKYKQKNILFMGETGVGKSTCINSTACYSSYLTLEEAKANEFLYLIPFELNAVVNGQLKQIQHGRSTNEVYKNGSSCTQSPVAHHFKMEDGYIISLGHKFL